MNRYFTIRPKAPNGSVFWLGKDGYLSVTHLILSAGTIKEYTIWQATKITQGSRQNVRTAAKRLVLQFTLTSIRPGLMGSMKLSAARSAIK